MKPDPGIAQLLADAKRKWGRGALVRLGDMLRAEVDAIPTGFPALDEALGIGGLPCGRISEIFGPDSSGKHALAAHLVVQCQRSEGVAAYIDLGRRLDPEQMRAHGVDFQSLLVARPSGDLEGLEMDIRLARRGGIRRGRDVMGCRSLIQVAKNKLAPPLKEAEVDLLFYRFPPAAPTLHLLRLPESGSAEGRLSLSV